MAITTVINHQDIQKDLGWQPRVELHQGLAKSIDYYRKSSRAVLGLRMILMNDFKAEPAALRSAELVAVERVLNSGWYVLGDEVRAFEQAWAGRCGTHSRDRCGQWHGRY